VALVSVQSYPGHTTHFFLCIWYLSTLTNAHHQQFYTTTYIFSFIIMSSFLLKKKKHMREALLFNLKKSAAESHRMLVEAYGDNTFGNNVQRLVSPVQWRQLWPEWQEAWKSAQEDWGLSIAGSFGRGRYSIAKNVCRAISQTAISMQLHTMGKVQKIGKWVPHELNDRQMERRQNTCQILLARQKKKVVPASDCDRRWKVDLFSES